VQKHSLTPIRRDLDRAANAIADRLLELKPKDQPKGRLQRASDCLSLLSGMILDILKLIAIPIVLVLITFAVIQQLWSSSDVVLEDFKVPPELEQRGYKPNVIATRLADQINSISDKTTNSVGNNIGTSSATNVRDRKATVTAKNFIDLPTFKLTSVESSLDIEVPQTRTTVGSLFRHIFESLGFKPNRIDGEIISRDNKLVLTIRITERDTTRVLGMVEEGSGNPEALLSKGAEVIYKDIKPVVMAWYLYTSSPTKKEEAQALLQDCIYQNKDAALANVLWSVILLNEADYDGALTKIKDAENLKRDNTIYEIMISCEARALEAKGNYEGAKAIYKKALRGPHSVLTLTNYAAFLASRGDFDEASEQYRLALYADSASDIAHIGMGLVLEGQGNYDEAIAEYRKAIELTSTSARAYSNLASALVNKKDYRMATHAAQRAAELDPDSADAHNLLGYVLYSGNQFDEAVKAFERAVTINPRFITAYVNWADALLNQKKYDEAIAKTKKALEINNKSALAHTEMALILINKNDFAAAIKECEQAVNQDPLFVAAYANWGSALLGQNKYKEAEQKAREITDLASEDADAHNNLGYVLQIRGKYDDAIKEFEKANKFNRFNIYVYINWAEALMNHREYAAADKKAQEAINLDAASADAHNILGYILRQSGKLDEAFRHHEMAIQLNPFNIYSYIGWADAMLAKKPAKDDELMKAVEYATKAVDKDGYSANAYNELGVVLQRLKKYKKAIDCHNKAAMLNPYNIYSYTNLSEVYLTGPPRFKNIPNALKMAYKAVETDSTSADAHGSVGWAQLSNKKYDDAITAFEKAVGLNSNSADLHVGFAEALRNRGRYGDALREAREALRLDPKSLDGWDELNALLREKK